MDLVVPSDRAELYRRFAEALVRHGGVQSKAAVAIGYKPGNQARRAGFDLSRHPEVLKLLQPMAMAQLQSLVPQAVETLHKLTKVKSPFVRLEASKDILNRNGVGLRDAPIKTQPLIVNINLNAAADPGGTAQVVLDIEGTPPSSETDPGVQNSESSEGARYPTHDFSQKVLSVDPDPAGEENPVALGKSISLVNASDFDL